MVVTIGAIAAYNYIKIKKMREDAQKDVHQHHLADREGEGASDGDDEDTEDEQDWNTIEGTYITSDGDILPNPAALEGKKGESSSANRHAKKPSVELPSKEEIAALAASKRELSD